MNFPMIIGIFFSTAIGTNITTTSQSGQLNDSNNVAAKFYKRWSNSKAAKLLLSNADKAVCNNGGKLNDGKLKNELMETEGKSKTDLKNRLIPRRFCNPKNCHNCNHGLLRNIFQQQEERYCKILLVAPDCCHNFFLNTGFYF